MAGERPFDASTNLVAIESQLLNRNLSVAAAITAVAREDPTDVAILDSADTTRGRFTILACDPVRRATWGPADGDPFEGMRELLRRTRFEAPSGPFAGAWIGFFSYEAGRYIEPPRTPPDIRRRDLHAPGAQFALFDTAAVYDAWADQWQVAAIDLPEAPSGRASAKQRVAALADRLLAVPPAPSVHPPAGPGEAILNMSRTEYLERVRRAREYIAAGDIFQVNFTRRMSFPLRESPLEMYLRLRRVNPAAYAAFLPVHISQGSPATILSASPELFLELHGRNALTRPIKGTRPRGADLVLDAACRAELAASPKDRAELAMIVDLERNDLGRVCEYGSIEVVPPTDAAATPFELEAHPTIHHLVGNVRGRLRPECDGIDLLRATFPGGSITGAPKVRAMEIIEELEPTERGVYTGAIGYFGLSGDMMFNLAIRTLVIADGQVHLQVGGGIVADSVPEDEFDETEDKARGLLRALGAENDTCKLRI